jgi:LPS O-antigen subunit length determinant protein (WzzB/FepE family)
MRIIWKWKYLLGVGTLIFAAIAVIMSLQMTKIYQVDMVLRPGILRMGEGGRNTYIDSPTNIQALIETGTFNREILAAVKRGNEANLPRTLGFGISIPKNSDTVKIFYETPEIETGVKILRSLAEHLITRYRELVEYYKNEHQKEIDIKKTEIDNFKAAAESSKEKIKNIQVRINELKAEAELINSNTSDLIKERDKFITHGNANNVLSSILYTNTIQQNLILANTYKNDINAYNGYLQSEKVALQEHINNQRALEAEIKNLEFKRDSIQNVQVLQYPTSNSIPIRPKKKLYVLLAALVGLFTTMFLALLLEYVSRHKEKDRQQEHS